MASIDKRPNGTWRARWREYPGGPQRTKAFTRRADADRWLVRVQHDLMTGAYVEPTAGRETVAAYAERWAERMRPSWRRASAANATLMMRHVLPVLGERALVAVKRSDVEALMAGLALAPSTVRLLHRLLAQMLGAAVEDGLLARNPCYRARLPRREDSKAEPVPVAVVEAIAAALEPRYRVVVALGVGLGLRQGEMAGLTVDRLDFLRRTVRVDRQYDDSAFAAPKTRSSHRTIPMPGFVVDALAEHLARYPTGPGRFVVSTPAGRALASSAFGRRWRRAVAEAGAPGLGFHALRHTYASTLLSEGVSIRAVADWLGHASPAITLSTYAHLMPADDDRGRAVLDRAFRAEDSLRTASAGPGL